MRQRMFVCLCAEYCSHADRDSNGRLDVYRLVGQLYWHDAKHLNRRQCEFHLRRDLYGNRSAAVQSHCHPHGHWLWYGEFCTRRHFMRQRVLVQLCAEYCSHADRDSNGRFDVYRLVR